MENENKLRALTGNHVLLCQSSLVDKTLKDGIFQIDDIENMFYIDYESMEWDIVENWKNELGDNEDEIRGTFDKVIGDNEKFWIADISKMTNEEIEELANIIGLDICDYEEMQEVFEWWVVSDYLINKLREHGEPILSNDYGSWWGRTTTGQVVYADHVIGEIFGD